MYKIFTILTLLLFFTQFTLGQKKTETDANITGDVQCNGEHIPFAHITVDGTTIGTTTDATGHYQFINMPVGTFKIRVSSVGYKTQVQEVTTLPNTTIDLKFHVEEDVLKMEEVVVSADRNQSNRAEAPVIVTSISPELLEQTQSVNIAEGLCFTPGLRTECNCQNCGFTQLRMNGMEGPYSQILMNSRPVFSGLAGVYGLELIPANMVQRIEVVRGGGSALFGGNAIAGTVNIITKEPTRNTFMFDTRYSLTGIGGHEGTDPAGDGQVNFNASVVSDDGKSGAYLYAMLRERDHYDENGDGFSEAVLIDNTTYGFNIYYKPTIKSKISLDGYRVNEFRRGGNKFEYLPHETDITEQVEHTITGANLAFDLFTNNKYDKLTIYGAGQMVDRNSYYGAMQDPNAYGQTDDITTSIGAQYVINAGKFILGASTTVFGVENNMNIIDDTKLGAAGEPNTSLTKQMVNTFGGFVQQDWKSEKFNLAVGFRYDNYLVRDNHEDETLRAEDISNRIFLPRVSAMYKFTPSTRFRLGYAMGYRAPQVFNEDLHIELVNATRVTHFNDENLTQETSHAYTASLNTDFTTGEVVHNFLAEGFYTKLEKPFADEFYELNDEGDFAYMRINGEGAYVTGINFELNSHFSKKLETQIGFTVQKSEFETPIAWGEEAGNESVRFMRTPDTYGFATTNWQPTKNFSTTLSLNYTGSMLVPHFGLDPATTDPLELGALNNGEVIAGERLEESEDFLIVDLLFNYKFKLTKESSLELYAGMKNIFNQTQKEHDKGVFRDAGYIYGPCQPGTINLGIKIGNIF
jgi:outer membrane receptor for ferrienterochelin and colicins